MNKYIIILLLNLTVFMPANSQDSSSLMQYSSWFIMTGDENCETTAVARYCYAYGDTLINNLKYRKMWVSQKYADPTSVLYYDDAISVLYYREEAQKIFRYDLASQKDLLLFDFSLEKDEEIEVEGNRRIKVIEVLQANQLFEYCTLPDSFKALKIRDINNPEKEDIWVEAVGSIQKGLLTLEELDDNNWNLVSARVTTGGGLFLNSNNNKSVYYVPFICNVTKWNDSTENNQNTEDKSQVKYEFVDDTLHISGMTKLCFPYNHLVISKKSKNIMEISLLPVFTLGSNMDVLSMRSFDVKIAGFKKGVYTIKTNPYMLPEKADTTIVCGKDVLRGDVNEDGTVNINDVVSVINIMAGL